MFEVWITKYALTQGIFKLIARKTHSENMIEVETQRGSYYHGEGKEWHLTKESAITYAENMRLKKIESLKKAIVKLEELDFNK